MLVPFNKQHAVPNNKGVAIFDQEHVENLLLEVHQKVLQLIVTLIVEFLHTDLDLERERYLL